MTAVSTAPARRAVLRFARERTAVAALAVLVLIALACLIGPGLTGHDPERAYPDLRQLPAGLTAQPDAARLRPALERLAFRMRARLDAVERDGDTLRLTLGSDAGVDRRSLVYLPRSALFGTPSSWTSGTAAAGSSWRCRSGACTSPSAPTSRAATC